MKRSEGIILKVGELTNRGESGRGIIRMDSRNISALGLKDGDVVEIIGKNKTGSLVVHAYPADIGLGIARMDGITRRNVGVGVGETVTIKKAKVLDAEKIVLAPAQKDTKLIDITTAERLKIPMEAGKRYVQVNPEMIKNNLFMRPLKKNDLVEPRPVTRRDEMDSINIEDMISNMFGITSFTSSIEDIQFVVTSTSPEGIVRVNEQTIIEVKSEAVEERAITVKYEDIGGLHTAIEKIREMVELPLRHPELFTKLGIDPPKGVLLYGPPGTGKTLLAKAVANESGAYFSPIAGPEIMNKFYGQSEENLRNKFEEAEKNAPSIIFIDEIDAIAPKREEVTGEVEKRVVSQLLALMDGLKARGKVIVIAATNRENALDPALRRGGRFDREIEIGVPDMKGRKEILQIHTRNMPLEKDVDLNWLAEVTYGFVGADLEAMTKEAAMSALRRNLPQISWKKEEELPADILKKLRVGKKDFQNALKMVEPSAMREVMVEIPNVKWDDIGGLEKVKESMKEIIEWPLKNPKAFERVGIKPPKGVLLYGPPGTGKTLLAKAVANESGANFISIRGPEVLSKWVGESEKRIRDVFKRAKQVAPSVIFFDEMDALVPRRGLSVGTRVSENVVSQILTQMSGIEDLHNVIIIGATNRPDIIDPALLRPGRFDRQVMVPSPDEKTRFEIFKIHTKNMPLKGVDLRKLAKQTEGYSGADIEAICREAGLNAIRENMEAKEVTRKHFDLALKESKPSITPDIVKFYDMLTDDFKSKRMEKGKPMKEADDYVG